VLTSPPNAKSVTSRVPQLGQLRRKDTAAIVYKFVQMPQGRIIDGRAYAAELMEDVKDGVWLLQNALVAARIARGEA
jgi:hypothetical protein